MRRCEKKKFATEEEAKSFNKKQSTYWCKQCECWHLTSNGAYKVYLAGGLVEVAKEWIKRHTRSRKKLRKNRIDEDWRDG